MPAPLDLFNLRSRPPGLLRRLWRRRERQNPAASRVTLGRHNIFILPSKQGMAFALVLLLILLAAINYEASLAFALVFLLASAAFLSVLHTYRNLAGLQLSAAPCPPVFAGESCEFTLILHRQDRRVHEGLQLGFSSEGCVQTQLLEAAQTQIGLRKTAPQRGRFIPGRLRVQTVFPLGIWRAWSWPHLQLSCLVYPHPEPCRWQDLLAGGDGQDAHTPGGEGDFYALREYLPGDSLRQVAWKHYARGQGMLTRQLDRPGQDAIWLDWERFAPLSMEARLSRLCYCALQLEAAGRTFGLRLPGQEIPPGRGEGQCQQVLATLALFEPQGQRS